MNQHRQQPPFLGYAAAPGLIAGLTVALLAIMGCQSTNDFPFDPHLDHYQMVATEIEFPDVQTSLEENPAVLESVRPVTLRNVAALPTWDLTLEEAVRTALLHSTVIRDSGGRVVSTPAASATVFDPAISQADPNFGAEAALAAFDANFSTSLFINRDERAFNNLFFGGGASSLASNTGQFLAEVSKTAATGTRYSLRHQVDYNRNNSPVNLNPSVYDSLIEAEFRHPLLQGSGIAFNRIAGPNSRPGQYNGVLLARLNNDVALTDFERAVRDLVRDVEVAYWNLHFAYRDLDAKKTRRDSALQTWQIVKARKDVGTVDDEREALVREQYYAAQSQLEDSLSGSAISAGGVHARERTLRRLMGLPTNDGRMIRPVDSPIRTDVVFDWDESLTSALWRRAEIRRQKWVVKRRELELAAAAEFIQMRLDMVGQYRWRGLGDQLLGDGPPNTSTYQHLFDGDLQGWQFGLQLSTPIGNRQAHAAMRHAELQLARERALLREQELQIAHDLADAFAEVDRAFTLAKSNFNRAIAAQQQVKLIDDKYEAGATSLEFLLDAQGRAADATTAFYSSLVQYSVAIANLHHARGSLLDYHQIHLTEGPWSEWAHTSALKQARRFRTTDHCYQEPCNDVSIGPYAQDSADHGMSAGIGQLPSEAQQPEVLPGAPASEGGTPLPASPTTAPPQPAPMQPVPLQPAVDPQAGSHRPSGSTLAAPVILAGATLETQPAPAASVRGPVVGGNPPSPPGARSLGARSPGAQSPGAWSPATINGGYGGYGPDRPMPRDRGAIYPAVLDPRSR